MARQENDLPRRSLLKSVLGAGALLGLARASNAAACADATPRQTEGPFYPRRPQDDTDWDLTRVVGREGTPDGEAFYLIGRVTDEQCRPVAGCVVEIWQACASGRYNHPGDTSGLPLDPNFQYWGRVLTDEDGNYRFKTIVPGDYPAAPGWQRPPHIHYKAIKRGYRELTTQMYFEGHPLNAEDDILNAVPASQRASVIVALSDPDPAAGLDLKVARFDLGLTAIRAPAPGG